MAEGGSNDAKLTVTKGYGFMNKFQDMKTQEYLTDFKLKVGEEEIACHKVVLAACSNYFGQLFTHKDALEVTQGFVKFETLNFTALQSVIDYCYSEHMKCNMDNAKHVIEAIEYLQIPDLKTDLSPLIVNRLNNNNSIGWYFFSKLYEMTTVQEKAQEIMIMEFTDVVRSSEFLELDCNTVIYYLSWEDIDQSSALVAAARWVMHNAEHRKNKFLDVLKAIIRTPFNDAPQSQEFGEGTDIMNIIDLPVIAQEFIAAFGDTPQSQESKPGAGFDIIVLGGVLADDTVNRRSWMVNLQTGETVEKACLPKEIGGLFDPAICSTAKGALFAGGASTYKNGCYFNHKTRCIIYLKADNMWALFPELSTAVVCAAAVCIGTKAYIIGGAGYRKNKMDCLDMKAMTWNSCPDLLQGLVYPVVGLCGHCIYVILSAHHDNEVTAQGLTLQCFDTTTSLWSFKASIPEAVNDTQGADAVTVDHRLFVIGGEGKICLSYDTREDAWTILTPPYKHHFFGSAVYLEGKIIVCGGYNEVYMPSDIIESYDPATDTWSILPVTLPKPLWNPGIIPV